VLNNQGIQQAILMSFSKKLEFFLALLKKRAVLTLISCFLTIVFLHNTGKRSINILLCGNHILRYEKILFPFGTGFYYSPGFFTGRYCSINE
jgi:hypothetical protein